MWAQQWSNVFDMVAPYPNATKIDLTQILKDQKYTPDRIFRVSFKRNHVLDKF